VRACVRVCVCVCGKRVVCNTDIILSVKSLEGKGED